MNGSRCEQTRAICNALDEVRSDTGLLLQLPQGGHPGIIRALVHPALRHLPGIVRIIDTSSDKDLAQGIKQHHSDAAAVTVTIGHESSLRAGKRRCNPQK